MGEEPYKANVMKITGNFFIVSCIETIAEAMTLAEKNGISRQGNRSCHWSTQTLAEAADISTDL